MYRPFEPYRRALKETGPIMARHVFLLVNGIIFAVVALLITFGDPQAGIFLGVIIVINILLGVGQDFRARVDLEKLQLLTAFHYVRIKKDGLEQTVLTEEIKERDRIKLKLGDQIPCDGLLTFSKSLEVSEALITGESDSFPRAEGERVLAGAIVTAGVGLPR